MQEAGREREELGEAKEEVREHDRPEREVRGRR